MGSLKITTTTTIEAAQPPQAAARPAEQAPAGQSLQASTPQAASLAEDVLETSPITSGTGVIKKIGGGLLLGSTLSGIGAAAAKSMATDVLHKPGTTSIGLGAALGAGLGLASIETGNQNINIAKNGVAGALIGGSLAGMVQSMVSSMATDYLHGPSTGGILMGTAIGGGIALANNTLEDKTLNNVKNVAAGALIGGGALGALSAVATSIATERLSQISPVAAGLGVALGAGVAIMRLEE